MAIYECLEVGICRPSGSLLTIIMKTGKNQQVSDWTQISVMIRTSVTLQQGKATHFESRSCQSDHSIVTMTYKITFKLLRKQKRGGEGETQRWPAELCLNASNAT